MKTVQLEEYVQKHDQLEEGYANMDQLEDQPLPEKRILLLLMQFEVVEAHFFLVHGRPRPTSQ